MWGKARGIAKNAITEMRIRSFSLVCKDNPGSFSRLTGVRQHVMLPKLYFKLYERTQVAC